MIDTIRSIPQLDRARDEWDALAAAFRTPLLEHDWFASCARTLHREDDLRVVSLRSRGSVAAIAPIVREETAAGDRLALLGSSALHEPGNWLYASPAALQDLARMVTSLGQPVIVRRVPAHSPLCGQTASLVGWRALRLTRPTRSSLAVETTGAWADYFGALSTRITENLARRRRKAERELGRLEAEILKPAPGDVDDLLATLVTVEGSGWKGRNGSALLHRPALRRFFADYCTRAAARKRLRVARLTFGSTVAAIEFAIEAYERVWQLKIGFDDAVAAYYPGLQLTQHSIEAAFDAGLEAYEFLGAAEAWQERWNPVERKYALVAMYPFTARGIAGAVQDIGGAFVRRAERSAAAHAAQVEVA